MQETRRARLQAVIQEELATIVPREVKDPRIPPVTFTAVEVTPDGSHATIYVTIFGQTPTVSGGVDIGREGIPPLSEKAAKQRMQDCLDGLTSASGYLRRHLAKVLNVRHIPTLAFKEDRGLENTIRVQELLKQISSSGDGGNPAG